MSIIKTSSSDVVNLTTETKEVKIFEQGNDQMLMEIIQNSQYMYPFRSVIRELVSNGIDSLAEKRMAINIISGTKQEKDYYIDRNTVEAKHSHFDRNYYDLSYLQTESKVRIIYTEGEKDDFLTIEDTGVGLSPMRLYAVTNVVAYSTKRNTKDQIGGYGCGSKVPFSLTDLPYFTIETAYNGMYMRRRVFKQYSTENIKDIDEKIFNLSFETKEGTVIKDIKYVPTDSKNYTKITIPCRKFWKKEFDLAIKTQLLYCEEVQYFINTNDVSVQQKFLAKKLHNSEHIILSDNGIYGKPHVLIVKDPKDLNRTEAICYGFINYEEMEQITPDGAIGIVCTIRQTVLDEEGKEVVIQEGVEVNPSRETIRYTQHTKAYIAKKMAAVSSEANNIIQSIINSEKDYLNWLFLAYQLLNDKYTMGNQSSLLVLKRLKAVATTITFASKISLDYTDNLFERTVFEELPNVLNYLDVDTENKKFVTQLQGLAINDLMPFVTINKIVQIKDEIDFHPVSFYQEDLAPASLIEKVMLKDCPINTEKILRVLRHSGNKIRYQAAFTPPSKEILLRAANTVLDWHKNKKDYRNNKEAKFDYQRALHTMKRYLLFLVIRKRLEEILTPLSVVLASEIANPPVVKIIPKAPELTAAQLRKEQNKGIIYFIENNPLNSIKTYFNWKNDEINISSFQEYLINSNKLAKAKEGTIEYDQLEESQTKLQKKLEPSMYIPMFPVINNAEPAFIGDRKPESMALYEVIWAILHQVLIQGVHKTPFPIYLMAQTHLRDLAAPTFLPIKNYLKGFLYKQPLEEGQIKHKICYMFPDHLRKAATMYLISTKMDKYRYLTNYKQFDEEIYKKFLRVLEYTGLFNNTNYGSLEKGTLNKQIDYVVTINAQVVANIKTDSMSIYTEYIEKQDKLIAYQYDMQEKLLQASNPEELEEVRQNQISSLTELFKTAVDDFLVVDREILTLIIELDAYIARLGVLFLEIELMATVGMELPVQFVAEMREYINYKLSQ